MNYKERWQQLMRFAPQDRKPDLSEPGLLVV